MKMNNKMIRVKTHCSKKVKNALLKELITLNIADFLSMFTNKQQGELLGYWLDVDILTFSQSVVKFTEE